jgi:hypothetical protein
MTAARFCTKVPHIFKETAGLRVRGRRGHGVAGPVIVHTVDDTLKFGGEIMV